MTALENALCALIRDKFEAESIPFMAAPCEAEMQMVDVERSHLVNGIITEYSDGVVFGVS